MIVGVTRLLLRFTVLLKFLLFFATNGRSSASDPPRVPCLKFIGTGYNLLDGNPEGSLGLGGVDPGIRGTHRVLQLTYNTSRLTLDGRFSIPDQVGFVDRLACSSYEVTRAYTGTRSYQTNLQTSVSASGSHTSLISYSFTMSGRYQDLQKRYQNQRDIFIEKTRTCNRGTARYEHERASERSDFRQPTALLQLSGRYLLTTGLRRMTTADSLMNGGLTL